MDDAALTAGSDQLIGHLSSITIDMLAPFLTEQISLEDVLDSIVERGALLPAIGAFRQLQKVEDYRGTLQRWLAGLRVGGYLILTVPHAFLLERKLMLPAVVNSRQRRLYTPASLLNEIEESLAPNTYRVRLLCDDDSEFNYALATAMVAGTEPIGSSDIVAVIEKIDAPPLEITEDISHKSAPDFTFSPPRTRREGVFLHAHHRILLLKLDHLGDFIMGIAAIERVRSLFPNAHITLVVGSWNLDMARALRMADEVVPLDVFPRNSAEEEVDVVGKAALLTQSVSSAFDIAIDLRVDPDTRPLLKSVNTELRAGIGTQAQFPFLDIFLPIDFSRGDFEAAREEKFDHHAFQSQVGVERHVYRLVVQSDRLSGGGAILWGPYSLLRPGRYFFEPFVEADTTGDDLLVDVALDGERLLEARIAKGRAPRLAFEVSSGQPTFEFRIWGRPLGKYALSFYGGRLVRAEAASVLHQSEYQILLVQLVADRVLRAGVLGDLRG